MFDTAGHFHYNSFMLKITDQHKAIFNLLPDSGKNFFQKKSEKYNFTFQELKILMEYLIDLEAWGEVSLPELWDDYENKTDLENEIKKKKYIIGKIGKTYMQIKDKPIKYSKIFPEVQKSSINYKYKDLDSKIFGFCPVRSPKTLCCNLRTLDAVLGCAFGCNYCALKSTFDESTVIFHKNFKKLLDKIEILPDRKYHVGTGQSSDALVWGNKDNMLENLFSFARENKNVFLELKTKSNNIGWLLENDVPSNVFPSFTLSPQIVIDNEEHFTATLEERLMAAKKLTDKKVKVAFHLHPVIIYEGWIEDYSSMVEKLFFLFKPSEIVFISMGTLHFPRPVLKKIRLSNLKSQIYKIPFTQNPEGKLTYTDERKNLIFKFIYSCFKPWHGKIFFYLCMESKIFWETTFSFAYETNEEFEEDFLIAIEKKLTS